MRRPRGDVDTARRDVGRPKKALDGAVFSTARRAVGRPKKAIDGASSRRLDAPWAGPVTTAETPRQ